MKPELLSILKKSSLFGMLEDAQLNALGKVSTVHKFSKGETIFVEGDLAAGFFFGGFGGSEDCSLRSKR